MADPQARGWRIHCFGCMRPWGRAKLDRCPEAQTSNHDVCAIRDLNIWGAKKRLEKMDYMHNNPVKRGLVRKPGDWLWSSWRFYYQNDASVLAMDRMP